MANVDLVVRNAAELLPFAGGAGPLIGDALRGVEIVRDGAIIAADGVIEWVGATGDLSAALAGRDAAHEVDASGAVVMPGFVDCHTHIPFSKGREVEFEMRIQGKSYLEIAAAGGGILNSVSHFRETPNKRLLELSRHYLKEMLRSGSTTIECKTGYGLALEHELRALEVIGTLAGEGPCAIVPTFLGAHMIPAEYRDDPDAYVEVIIEEMIPAVVRQGIARYCDVFIEEGALSVDQARRVLTAAKNAGLELKLHVDEFNPLGGSALAAELGAVSADHLDAVTGREATLLASAGVIGVLMPGVNYFLGNNAYAPARRLVEASVPIALATDFNPGSCMCHSMEMILSLACTQLRLLPIEALAAATRNAAYACGVGERAGRLQVGYDADVLVMDGSSHQSIPYHFGTSHVREVIKSGVSRYRD